MKLIVMGLLACATVSLSGCAGVERMNAQMAAQQQAADQNKCSGYGYKPGTDAYADCMMATSQHRDQQQADAQRMKAWQQQQQANRDAKEAADRAAADQRDRDNVQKMMNGSGSSSFIPPQPQVVSPQPVSPTTSGNCTSTTTSQSSDNAGSSTTTTTCSN